LCSRASVITGLRLCLRRASCGTRCAWSTPISAAKGTRLVNYAKRYRAGLRVGTSVTEGTDNFLVNRRMMLASDPARILDQIFRRAGIPLTQESTSGDSALESLLAEGADITALTHRLPILHTIPPTLTRSHSRSPAEIGAGGVREEGEPGVTGSAKIVLVEDEAFQRQVIAECLAQHGLRATSLASGGELKRLAHRAMPDLVLLDLHLNEPEDGFALARWLRSRSARIGIIILTVAGDTIDRVVGLESGADDYIAKPFEPRELVARVKALLRRAAAASLPTRLTEVRVGTAMLDLTRRMLILADGEESGLTASEFDLLRLFVENPNRPLTRDWLLETIAHRDANAFDRAIDNRILRLRRKLERDPNKPEAIRSVRGVGYMFVPSTD
jgi:DNA-binding response OmpR family regulator